MPLTRDFRETTMESLRNSAVFRRAVLREALNAMMEGDVSVGKTMLRDYINGTIGFPQLGEVMNRSPKSLMRMLSAAGNPQAKNFFELVAVLQKHEGVRLELKSVKTAA
ncbi:MAG: transcriptional regulator [Bryocella sp.]